MYVQVGDTYGSGYPLVYGEEETSEVGPVEVEWWPQGRPNLSPAWPLCTAVVRVATVSPRWEGEVAPGGAVGGEDAPVGKGPRRTRPHPGARTKYIAPVEVHRGG